MHEARRLLPAMVPAAGLALAAVIAAGGPASADPGDKGHRMRGGEARAEAADSAAPAPPPLARSERAAPASRPGEASPRAAPPPAASVAPAGDARRELPRPDLESRRRAGGQGTGGPSGTIGTDGSHGWTPRPGTPRMDGGPDSPAADPAVAPPPEAAPDRRREGGHGHTDRSKARGHDQDREYRADRGRGSPGDGYRDDRAARDAERDRDRWRRGGSIDPRYRWHWRQDPRWRFDPRWGFYDPFWRFDWQWGWYDPRWGWNPRWGYDPGWGWGGPYGLGYDWRRGVRADTAIAQDPLLRRWAVGNFDANRDGWLDPVETRRAARALEEVADLNGDGRLDAREIAFARAEIERFGWDRFRAISGNGDIWR